MQKIRIKFREVLCLFGNLFPNFYKRTPITYGVISFIILKFRFEF